MDVKLQGAVVLITGASRGLGLHFAHGFAKEGARIAICARNPETLKSAATQIRAHGAECLAIPADLFLAEDCIRVVNETAAAFGRLDVLVNNASTNVDRPSEGSGNLSDDHLTARFMGKTMAAIRCSRAAIPHMRKIGGGRIICIGGTSARSVFRNGEGGTTASGLPKGLGNAALANFVKHQSEEVARENILVNVVHPHFTRTDRHDSRVLSRARELGVTEKDVEKAIAAQIPIGRMVEPDDITPLILFLSSPLTSATTGQSITVDGGAVSAVSY